MLEALLKVSEAIARKKYDGHLTLMKFTTHWKAMFGTPNLDTDGRKDVRKLKAYPSLEEALFYLIVNERERNAE